MFNKTKPTDIATRDLMAPDTEPTDDELRSVMREVADVVKQRNRDAEAWVKQRLREEVARIHAEHPVGRT